MDRVVARTGVVALVAAVVVVGLLPSHAQASTGLLVFMYQRADAEGNTTFPGGTLTITQAGVSTDHVVEPGGPAYFDLPLGTTTLSMTPEPLHTAAADTYVGSETTSASYEQAEVVTIQATAPALQLREFAVQNPFAGTSATSGVDGARLRFDALGATPGVSNWNLTPQDGGPQQALFASLDPQPEADLTTDASGVARAWLSPIAAYGYARASASKDIAGVTWSGTSPPGFMPPGPGRPAYVPIAPQGPEVPDTASRALAGRVGPSNGSKIDYTVSVNGEPVSVDDRGWWRTVIPSSPARIVMDDAFLVAQVPMPVTFDATTQHASFLDIAYPDSVVVDVLPDVAGQPYDDFALQPGQSQCLDLSVLGAASVTQGCTVLRATPALFQPQVLRVRYLGGWPNPELAFSATATGEIGSAPYPVIGVVPAGGHVLGNYTYALMLGQASPEAPEFAALTPEAATAQVHWTTASSVVAPVKAYQVQHGDVVTTVPSTERSLQLTAQEAAEGVAVRSVNAYGPSVWRRAGAPDSTAPTVVLTSPAMATLASALSVRYSGKDAGSGIASFDLRYRRTLADGSMGAWQYPGAWSRRRTTSAALSLEPGHEYCVSARARDRAGNVSVWSSAACTARALDDRRLYASTGWTRQTDESAYFRTVSTASRPGAQLSTGVRTVRRMWLVATTCPSCGQVEVLVGGRVIATVSLRSSLVRHKVLVRVPLLSSRTGRIQMRVASAQRPVRIDGLVARQT